MLSSILFLLGLVTISQCQNVSPHQNVSNIFNQYVVKPNELPFQVSLYNITPTFLLCGGCLINSLYIVTNAHCVYGQNIDNMAAVAGIKYVLKNMENRSVLSHIRSIKKIIINPEFEPQVCANDFALVRLKLPFAITKEIGYARLPNFSFHISRLLNSRKMGTIFGYGLFNKINTLEFTSSIQLVKFNASPIDIEECRIKYQEIYNVTYDQICAYALLSGSESTATYSLDSGSSLVIDDILIGIQSCAPSVPNLPIIFTQVSSYILWIEYEVFNEDENDTYPAGDVRPRMELHYGGV